MHKALTPTQDKALTAHTAAGPRVEVVLARQHKHFHPGDVIDVTPAEAETLIEAGIGAPR